MAAQPEHALRSAALGGLAPLTLLLMWTALARKGDLIPPPSLVWDSFVSLLQDGELLLHLRLSLPRLLIGFSAGSLAGVALGVAMGLSQRADRLFGASFHAVRQVPLVGWLPLVVLWFGVSETARYVFISLGAFYPAVLNSFTGVRSVPQLFIELARAHEYPRWLLLKTIVIPAALPAIRTGSLVALNMSWVFVVVGETLTETQGGLATLLNAGRETFRMDLIIIGIVLTGGCGYALNLLARGVWAFVLHRRVDLKA